jgi:hypothetical protein
LSGLIPRPLLPGEKGRKNFINSVLAPLPRERGWGEAGQNRGVVERLDKTEGLWRGGSKEESISG